MYSIHVLELLESSDDGQKAILKISDGTWPVNAVQIAACSHLESQAFPNFKGKLFEKFNQRLNKHSFDDDFRMYG
jgi:hypothetical protein